MIFQIYNISCNSSVGRKSDGVAAAADIFVLRAEIEQVGAHIGGDFRIAPILGIMLCWVEMQRSRTFDSVYLIGKAESF